MSRREFTERIKVKRLHFADFKCEGIVEREDGTKSRCNATLVRSRVEFDHDNPDALTGEPTFENCRALCRVCHDEKTRKDQAIIAKAKRREADFIGAGRADGLIPSRVKAPKVKREKPKLETASGVSEIARRFGLGG